MADKTGIEWTDATWNPLAGCSIVSPGCTNCYAMKQAARLLDKPGSHYEGTTKKVNGNAVWTGKVSLAPEHILTQPLRWKRPRRIFVNSMSDLFHESVPDEWIDQVFAIMALCPQHIFQVLTKRADRMRSYIRKLDERGRHESMTYAALLAATGRFNTPAIALNKWPLPNVWLGVSVEDQTRANERIPILLDTPAAMRFLSCEPLLGALDLTTACNGHTLRTTCADADGMIQIMEYRRKLSKIDWVIVGGESGPGARAMHPDWGRSLRDQCVSAGVPFFFKQWGEWIEDPYLPSELAESLECEGKYQYLPAAQDGSCGVHMAKIGKKKSGCYLDDKLWHQFPGVLK